MYRLEFLPIAKKDIDEIIYYISHNLRNIIASKKLRNLFVKSFDNILEFPYGCYVYSLNSKLDKEYRSYKVKNFLIFYTINEKEKIVTIVRILYKKMDINNILK